ncbi:hypothetical protein GCM10008018_33830 [Paenibacillus marchantiophytorum]|uniref:VCBS repeat-containing protein n=1 Tax=Paenibacillus marchantiophytorum TaxID=1619310 RepID=A0ABQ1ESU1_9BACL|nr:hypothetical protein [Paenibacillus marchantiophytorum]GFZ85017.1 hypothetical protein GCM10008018_33830 [Paenibacillus marchantiophytorum]
MKFRKFTPVTVHKTAVSLLISSLLLWGGGFAAAEELPPPAAPAQQGQLIQTREIDVTGDGKPDIVSLFGSKADTSSPYFDKLYIAVSGQAQQQVIIPLEGGYNPYMAFCDFIGDKLPQIYVAAETGGSGGLSYYYIYSLKNDVPTAIPLPEPLRVTSTFKNNYKVKLKIEETGKSFLIDLSDRKDDYEKFGVYKDGKVVKPLIVNVDGYGALKPIDKDNDGICELMGIQRITGIANADTIGYATSIWKWKKGKWVLMKSAVVKNLPNSPR